MSKKRRNAFKIRGGAGSFDDRARRANLTKLGDPLVRRDAVIDWEIFRDELRIVHERDGKSNAGRKPIEPCSCSRY